MTDEELRAYPKVTCVIAAKYLGIDPEVLRCGVENHEIPIGYVPHGEKRRGTMWVNVEALIKYKHGEIDGAAVQMFTDLAQRVSKLERMRTA
ncbi:MAG: hypothetical protein IJT41_12000 [Clostridia bacterium]|nr:hypothetical protein [Clostridia bacterium]